MNFDNAIASSKKIKDDKVQLEKTKKNLIKFMAIVSKKENKIKSAKNYIIQY